MHPKMITGENGTRQHGCGKSEPAVGEIYACGRSHPRDARCSRRDVGWALPGAHQSFFIAPSFLGCTTHVRRATIVNAANFQYAAAVLKQTSGLVLDPDKSYLLESRLAPVAKKYGCSDLDALIGRMRSAYPAAIVRDVVEAMTTNESFFFRDIKPFEAFRDNILPELMQERRQSRALRIWCAAASTGQEPYSLAIILHEEASRLFDWTCEILATDISTEVLAKAAAGTYTHFEAQRGLSIQRLVAHFDKKDDRWQLKPELRNRVRFRHFNLLDNPEPLGKFDVVYCRNVLIYFDQPTKSKVLDSIARVMNPGGILVLGGAETAFGISSSFKPWGEQHAMYRLATPTAEAAVPHVQLRTLAGMRTEPSAQSLPANGTSSQVIRP